MKNRVMYVIPSRALGKAAGVLSTLGKNPYYDNFSITKIIIEILYLIIKTFAKIKHLVYNAIQCLDFIVLGFFSPFQS